MRSDASLIAGDPIAVPVEVVVVVTDDPHLAGVVRAVP
jgi:hypothetical protein